MTTAVFGEMPVSAGPELMMKFCVVEETPLRVSVTTTVAVPAAVSKFTGTVAVIDAADIVVIGKDVVTPPNVQFTTGEVVEKLDPVNTRFTEEV